MCKVRKTAGGKFKVTGTGGKATTKAKATKQVAAIHASGGRKGK